MMRLVLGGAFFLLAMIFITSSLSHGFLSRIPTISRRESAGVTGLLILAATGGWLYFTGDLDYLVWLYQLPARPAEEKSFVDLVEQGRNAWSLETTSAARAAVCGSEAAKLANAAPSVNNWVGTVSTTYLIGKQAVLVVRIGRYVVLRTPYNGAEAGSFIERETPAFEQLAQITSGAPVFFSGKVRGSVGRCIFDVPSSDDDPKVEVLFDFTDVKPA